MRTLAGALAAIGMALLVAAPAAASCAPPVSVTDNATRATAIVHGTVTDASGGALTLHVDRVFKGRIGVGVRVFGGGPPEPAWPPPASMTSPSRAPITSFI